MVTRLNQEIKDKILEFLKDKNIGASCVEISKGLKHNRITISKYLEIMKAQKLISSKEFAQSKIWSTFQKEKQKKVTLVCDDEKIKELFSLILDLDKFELCLKDTKTFDCKDISSNLIITKSEDIFEKLKSKATIPVLLIGTDYDSINLENIFEINQRISEIISNDYCSITGLPDKKSLKEYINKEISPVKIIEITIEGFDNYKKEMGIIASQNILKLISKIIKNNVKLNTHIAHVSENKFCITTKNYQGICKSFDNIKEFIKPNLNLVYREAN
ncbi:GGDEF domain-containing protein [Candidatus Woesearchaeota archaeon]|nr:GGDEF domain-containing protein [Candidatus Woesearchaeota archaeon]